MNERYLCIHGHFYQPPRENPWLEDIEVQDSAHPYHNWNERITRECYGPNTASRLLDDRQRIVEIRDNYRRISFNFGPTLLSWMARRMPDIHQRIVESDRASVADRSGHGNALAQVYNHMIMPLASARDKITQVRWGIRDFEARFGRKPEGMWLAETAADTESLEVLADHGVRFTVLSPTQALRVRPRNGGPDAPWTDVDGGRVDPSRAYRWTSPSGKTLALFFYDAPISRAVAFEGILNNGETFAARLLFGFDPSRSEPQLMHIATDGESYGHHHRFGDMALAYALKNIERSGAVRLTNYAEFLDLVPPRWDAEIHEKSSWSCPHGVERWRSDCGCRIGYHGQWNQSWRTPLREALDGLRDSLDRFYEERAGALLRDPWAARNDYIDVILDRSPASVARFFDRHALRALEPSEQVDVLKWMEMQRHRLLMYTSCAWFFDEISGLESVTVLQSAARALQIAAAYPEGAGFERDFLSRLSLAKSNIPEFGNGAQVWDRFVRPVVADLARIAAHQALKSLSGDEPGSGSLYAYHYEFLDQRRESSGASVLGAGRIRVTSVVTRESLEAAYAVLHMGGHDFHCVLKSAPDARRHAEVRDRLFDRFLQGSLTEVLSVFARDHDPQVYTLQDLLLEERRHVLGDVIQDILTRFEGAYRRLVGENLKLMNYLRRADFPMPSAFRLSLQYVLTQDMQSALANFGDDEATGESLRRIHREAHAFGVTLDWSEISRRLQILLERHVESLTAQPDPAHARKALALLDLADRLEIVPPLWRVENLYFDLWHRSLRAQSAGGGDREAGLYRRLAERLRFA
jgi:hypothetical protein